MVRVVRRGLALVVIVGVVAGIGLYLHTRGARFLGSVAAVNMSFSACIRMLTTQPYGFGSAAAKPMCTQGASAVWLSASVTNVGHSGARLRECRVQALDQSNHVVFDGDLSVGPLGLPLGNVTALYLDPGQTVRWQWFLTSPQALQASRSASPVHYLATCPTVQ
jgi:hypothetical protein